MDTNKIYEATNSEELREALKDYMNEAVHDWWRGISEDSRKAIRLLGFSRSVISSMMFFPDTTYDISAADFQWEYSEWAGVLERKIKHIIETKAQDSFTPDCTFLMVDYERMNSAHDEIKAKIAPLGLSENVQEMAIEDLLSRDKRYNCYRDSFYSGIENIRKSMLWAAVDNIKKEGN